jgi:hypothetical protein
MYKRMPVFRKVFWGCVFALALIATFAPGQSAAPPGTSPDAGLVKVDFKISDSDSGLVLHATRSVPAGTKGFDFMTNMVPVTYKTYANGPFITSICGVEPKGEKFWALYVGGTYSTNKGIGDIVITNNIQIGWKTKDQ